MDSFKNELRQIIASNYDIQRITTKTIFMVTGETIERSEVDSELHEILNKSLTPKSLDYYRSLNPKDAKAAILKSFAVVHADQRAQASQESSSVTDLGINLGELCVLVDAREYTDEKSSKVIYDKENDRISHYNYRGLKDLINSDKIFNSIKRKEAIMVYEPFKEPAKLIEETIDGKTVNKLNKYKQPSWLGATLDRYSQNSPENFVLCKNVQDIKPTELPELARRFFDHLLPQKASQNYVFSFIFDSLTRRNGSEYMLVLNSPTGTGKNILVANLIYELVGGSDNWGTASQNLFTDKFNSEIVDKRIIMIDEAKVTPDSYASVKKYANKMLNIERKGVDANNVTEIFLSFIICNNIMGQYYVHYDDRRNSIVEVTNKKIEDYWTPEELDEFTASLREPEYIKQIGEFILTRSWQSEKERSKNFRLRQFKGQKFYKFVERHLSSWQKMVLKVVVATGKRGDDSINISDLIRKIDGDKRRSKTPQEDTIIEFIQSYKHKGKNYLGEVVSIYDEEEGYEINRLMIDKSFISTPTIPEDDGDDLL